MLKNTSASAIILPAQYYYSEYSTVLLFFLIASLLGGVLLTIAFILSKGRELDPEKLSAYECGFDPFSNCRSEFNVHFYLIGILFIVFDLELILLFPWSISVGSFQELTPLAVWSAIDFLIELTIGFVYVWLMGSLEL